MGTKVETELLRTSSTGNIERAAGSGGFMLLDMVLALTILLLLFAVVWPTFGRGTSRIFESATVLDMVTLLRSDRTAAMLTGVPKGSLIDVGRRTVTGTTGRTVSVPADMSFDVNVGKQCVKGARQVILVFAPDGTSCGGFITLRRARSVFTVRINWHSGMIDVVHAPKI